LNLLILRPLKKATKATKEKYFSKNYGVILGTQDADLASTEKKPPKQQRKNISARITE